MSGEDPAAVPQWGAVHVHTDFSDGGIDVPRVIEAAHAAELDFIVLTDHNTLDSRLYEGVHDGLTVLVEVEITPSPFRHHLLALGLKEYPDLHEIRDPRRTLDEVIRLGATAWVPHPQGFRNLWCCAFNARWRHWEPRITGIELGTFLVEWVEGLRPWNFVGRLRDPLRSVEGLDSRSVALWDRLNAQYPVAGFLGIDAHYREKLGGWIHTPTYECLFRTNNVLVWVPPPTGNPREDVAAVRRTLRDGDFVNVRAHVAGRRAVRFWGGETALHLEAPETGTQLVLRRDGATCLTEEGPDIALLEPSPGVYRAEVWVGDRLWALSNPIRIPVPQREAAVTSLATR